MTGQSYPAHVQSEIEPARAKKSRVWRWRNAVSGSRLDSSTKHILLELSHNMDGEGGSCFPTIADLCTRTGRSKKTVQNHLRVAEAEGWIDIRQGAFSGQKWKRYDYVARWPDAGRQNIPTEEKAVEMTPEAGGIDDQKVGEPLPQDKNISDNISDNSPDGRAGARETERSAGRRYEPRFLRWVTAWPGYDRPGALDAAWRVWSGLADRERTDCIANTPAFLAGKARGAISSPAVYLRKRRFYEIAQAETPPERVQAKYCGPLWMAWWFWRLVQPPNGRIVVTQTEQTMIRDGKATLDGLMREKRRKHGWPDALAMVETFRDRKKLAVPFAMTAVSAVFVAVPAEWPLFAAWRRLHDRRDWPFPDLVGKVMWFPPIRNMAGNLDDEVEVALAAFEQQARGIFDGRT